MELTQEKTTLFDMKRLTPRTEKEYDELVGLLNTLLDAGGRFEGNSLSELVNAIGDIVKEYEDIHYPDEDFV